MKESQQIRPQTMGEEVANAISHGIGAALAIAGTVIAKGDELIIACGGGSSIKLLTLQPEGSKPMSAKQMLCGNPVEIGEIFGDING